MKKRIVMLTLIVVLAGLANAADVHVTADITESTLWTNDNVYYLDDTIYVEPGASLTIQPGTLIIGNSDTTDNSALVVSRGAQIYAMGTVNNPIIFTSNKDDFTTWRDTSGEWGNLTIMGDAIIAASKDTVGSNQFDGMDEAQMEGLAEDGDLSDPRTLYGGANDDDSSGALQYVSLRYGGKVLSLANELNGLSLGGVGRGTDISHIEIMNNIDDGIEIWGGTVSMKYVSIWNIGDDSFDLDQGYRGKAQFGLIVQGYCGKNGQGSGIGDNCFEMDGAENNQAQPYAQPLIYNFTAIGQPDGGDHATDFRDNMRAQFHNCIFMDVGKNFIDEGRGGYDDGDVPPLVDLFSLSVDVKPGNEFGMDVNAVYPNFTSGNWCQFTNCVLYNVDDDDATVDVYGVMDAAFDNVIAAEDAMPIVSIERGDPVQPDGEHVMRPVVKLNPLAAGDALTSTEDAPDDGFFTSAPYKGAFGGVNWLKGWTAADAYGMVD